MLWCILVVYQVVVLNTSQSKLWKIVMTSGILQSTTELTNLLALCKSLSKCDNDSNNSESLILVAISPLECYVVAEQSSKGLEDSILPLVKFICEQLNLGLIPKNGRRYSTHTLTTAFLWQLTSSSLYKRLRQLLILASISRLRKLSADFAVESGKLDLDYLKQRSVNLTQQEKSGCINA